MKMPPASVGYFAIGNMGKVLFLSGDKRNENKLQARAVPLSGGSVPILKEEKIMTKSIDIYKDRFEKLISVAKQTRFWEAGWKISKDQKKRWADLLKYWEEIDSSELMVDAMHLMHWGILRTNHRYNTKELELLSLIAYELQAKGEAFEVWFEDEMIEAIFFNIIEEMDSYGSVYHSSIVHHKAMVNNTVWEVMLQHPDYPDAKEEALLYKEFVCKLIPEAVTWTKAQWMDDQNIFAAIKVKYGIDCELVNPNDDPDWTYAGLRYDRIALFYQMLKCGMGNGSTYALVHMPIFTKELLQVLCDGHEEELMIESYLKAYTWAQVGKITIRRCDSRDFTCSDLKNSYLHRYLLQCPFVTENEQLKEVVFDVQMCG